MANKKTVKRVLSGEQLAKAIAETIFGWKNVHKYGGQLLGKRPDKAGRWRKYKVPDFANDPRQAYAIDARMEQLACWERYNEELIRIAMAYNLPPEWATPEQRYRAALRALPK
jgi:hypothetical protein